MTKKLPIEILTFEPSGISCFRMYLFGLFVPLSYVSAKHMVPSQYRHEPKRKRFIK